MPSGNSHTQIATLAAVAVIVGGAAAGLFLELGEWTPSMVELGAAAVGILIGDLFLSPDLDGAASNCKRRWGPLRFIWRFYEKLPHRSPLSHWPVIGDAGRLLYLGVVLAPIPVGAGLARDGLQGAMLDTFWVMSRGSSLIKSYPRESAAAFAGLCLATLLHGLADMIVSEGKKMVDYELPKRGRGGRPRKKPLTVAPARARAKKKDKPRYVMSATDWSEAHEE